MTRLAGQEESTVRPAGSADATAICEIYNQGIEDRIATLETRLRTPGEMRQWLASRGPRHPVVVAQRQARAVGWASLNAFNPRPAYDHVADFSLYVDREARGHGIGTLLMNHVERLARELEYHKLVLAMFPWNEAGITLYERHGLRRVGVYREQGRLDDAWVDTLIMEKILR